MRPRPLAAVRPRPLAARRASELRIGATLEELRRLELARVVGAAKRQKTLKKRRAQSVEPPRRRTVDILQRTLRPPSPPAVEEDEPRPLWSFPESYQWERIVREQPPQKELHPALRLAGLVCDPYFDKERIAVIAVRLVEACSPQSPFPDLLFLLQHFLAPPAGHAFCYFSCPPLASPMDVAGGTDVLSICRNGRLVNDILAVQRELSFFPEDFLQYFVWHYLGAQVWQEVQDLRDKDMTPERLRELAGFTFIRPDVPSDSGDFHFQPSDSDDASAEYDRGLSPSRASMDA